MDPITPDDNAINGTGSASDYDYLTGGIYSASQDPATAVDNGMVNNAVAGTGTANAGATVTPPAGGSSYTPPAWLSGLLGAAGSVGVTATQIAGVVNGKAATSPAAAGQPLPTAGRATVSTGGMSLTQYLPWILGGVVAVILGIIVLKKKK
jgi:hypothetical protein